MKKIQTNITPKNGMSAGDLDSALRQNFVFAVKEGKLDIAWNKAQTQARVNIEIIQIGSARELTELFNLLGGEVDIQSAA